MAQTAKIKFNIWTTLIMLGFCALAFEVEPLWNWLFGYSHLYNSSESLLLNSIFVSIILVSAAVIGWFRGKSSWPYVLIGTVLYLIPWTIEMKIMHLVNNAYSDEFALADYIQFILLLSIVGLFLALISFVSGWLRARFFPRKSGV